jgi:hypothetical protein
VPQRVEERKLGEQGLKWGGGSLVWICRDLAASVFFGVLPVTLACT